MEYKPAFKYVSIILRFFRFLKCFFSLSRTLFNYWCNNGRSKTFVHKVLKKCSGQFSERKSLMKLGKEQHVAPEPQVGHAWSTAFIFLSHFNAWEVKNNK